MGFLKQMKDMKNTLHEAPGMIAQAQELGAQAQAYGAATASMAGVGTPHIVSPGELEPIAGISLERYAQLAKAVGTRHLQGQELDAFLVGNGHNPADWQAAYDGWNERMKANMGLSTQFGSLYQASGGALMGIFKDISALKKQAKEIDKTFDPGAQMRDGKQRMAAAQQMLAQQTVAVQLVDSGEQAFAQVVASRDTGTQINMQPTIELDLLVMPTGRPPYPAKVTQLVPNAQLGLVAPGSTISVFVDPSDPTKISLGM